MKPLILGRETGGDSGKIGSWVPQNIALVLADEKKYSKKIVFNPHKVKTGSKRRQICITQNRGSTLPRSQYDKAFRLLCFQYILIRLHGSCCRVRYFHLFCFPFWQSFLLSMEPPTMLLVPICRDMQLW